jgi:DNA-binding GntR family transcriptional regulator
MAQGVGRHHEDILESLLNRDAARAEKILSEHFERSQSLMLVAMDQSSHR